MTHKYNSENVFEVIGDYPVVDQFDVLYSNLLSGSIFDSYVTGALFYKTNIFEGLTPTIFGERGEAFSRLGVSSDKLPFPSGSSSTSYSLQPWRERAGIIRNIRIFSNDERFYDSMQPLFSELYGKIDGDISEYSNQTALIALGNPYSPTFNYTNSTFRGSFPFEPKYSGIERTKRQISYNANIDSSGNPLDDETICKKVVVYEQNVREFLWTNGFSGQVLNEIDASKILFGFGDRIERYKEIVNVPPAPPYVAHYGEKYLPDFRAYHDPGILSYCVSPIIRGWKYGLIDGNPHYTSAVYRRDRYGQVRDMLEQRQIAFTVKDPGNSIYFYPDNFTSDEPPAVQKGTSEGSLEDLTGDHAVFIKFIKQKVINNKLVNIAVSPDLTWSSNLSTYATSSLPYYDAVPKNRPLGTVITNIQNVTLTLQPDAFGNITITS
jgi:hypothetical protein